MLTKKQITKKVLEVEFVKFINSNTGQKFHEGISSIFDINYDLFNKKANVVFKEIQGIGDADNERFFIEISEAELIAFLSNTGKGTLKNSDITDVRSSGDGFILINLIVIEVI